MPHVPRLRVALRGGKGAVKLRLSLWWKRCRLWWRSDNFADGYLWAWHQLVYAHRDDYTQYSSMLSTLASVKRDAFNEGVHDAICDASQIRPLDSAP